jgi:hypothetical protein
MPVTYQLISSNVLSSNAASVTFSSIPATYTDLVVRASARSSAASPFSDLRTTINSNTTQANYLFTYLLGSGSTVSSGLGPDLKVNDSLTGNTATADTFSSIEYYIPSYTANQTKPFSIISNIVNNSTADWAVIPIAYNYQSTTAISTLKLSPPASVNFLSGSSFYLYGIKNS